MVGGPVPEPERNHTVPSCPEARETVCIPAGATVAVWTRAHNDLDLLGDVPFTREPDLYLRGTDAEVPYYDPFADLATRSPATGTWERHKPTSFPLGAMPLWSLRPATTFDMCPGDILVLLSDGFYEQCNALGEQFGDERVRAIVRTHHAQPVADLLAELVRSVEGFAGGVPQEDDMTAVVVKRESPFLCRSFERGFDSIPALAAFGADAFARLGIDGRLLPTVDLAVEELFTNMVKYGTGSEAQVQVGLMAIDDGVELTLIDGDVEAFDVTRSPEVDVAVPIGQRTPGGLGLQLLRRMADSLEYEYKMESRQSRTTLRVTLAGMAARSTAGESGGGDARN